MQYSSTFAHHQRPRIEGDMSKKLSAGYVWIVVLNGPGWGSKAKSPRGLIKMSPSQSSGRTSRCYAKGQLSSEKGQLSAEELQDPDNNDSEISED